jgi:hypothetical protein
LPAVDWITVAAEREAFLEGQPGQYATTGTFDGIGMIYLSVSKRIIEFKGFRRITLPHLGQQPGNAYEVHSESFTIRSLIRVADTEYAFQGVSDGPFGRTVTGKVRYSVTTSGLVGTVEEFLLEEHGQQIKGVMNRYSMARSAPALEMLKRYAEVFLGGNYVALDFAPR